MRRIRWFSGVTAVVALAALSVGTTSADGSSTSAEPSAGAVQGAPQTVRLVTGDIVRLTTDPSGRQTAQIIKAQHTGPGSVFQTFTRGTDEYVVPQSAVPYLGSRLDVGLFDVTRLAQQAGSSLAVTVQLAAKSSTAAITGLKVQSRTGTTLSGTFTAESSKAFGRALAAQAMRDHASPTHTTGLFNGIAEIAPAAGSQAAPAKATGIDDSTLTVKGIDWAGNPDNGDSYNIYNVDDMTLYAGTVSFVNGTAQVTVPDGHYTGLGFFYDYVGGNIYEVTLPQFTVSGDTTVTVDARQATSEVSITTPQASTPFANAMEAARTDANGVVGSYSFTAGSQSFFVKPIKKAPSIGKLYYWVYTRAFGSASKAKAPYSYDLKYGSTGTISANQTYAPKAKSLAAITSTYGADHPAQASLDARFGAFSWEQFLIASDNAFTVPLTRTEYYTASKTLTWSGVDYQIYVSNPFTLLGEIDSSWRTYQPGYTATQPWGDDPSHPRLLEHDVFLNQTVCPACMSGKTLDALGFPFGDNSEEHRAYPDAPTSGLSESASWMVEADGSPVSTGTGVLQAAAPMGSASTYAIDYATTRSSSDFLLSTKTQTTWSVPADAPQSKLPSGWTCTLSGGTNCTVLPLMTVDYGLPVSTLGQIKSGDATGTIDIGHLAGANVKVKSLQVKVSFDGGSTYTKATVTGGKDGTFTVAFTVPKAAQTDGFGALSISARDANGATLTEKIAQAFAVKGK